MNRFSIIIVLWLPMLPAAFWPDTVFPQGSSEEREAEASAAREMKEDEIMSATEAEESVDGEVVGVNPEAGTMTVKETDFDNEPYIFIVNKNTSFSGSYSFSDIRIGDKISVDYIYYNGRRTADNVVMVERGPEKNAPKSVEKFSEIERVLSD